MIKKNHEIIYGFLFTFIAIPLVFSVFFLIAWVDHTNQVQKMMLDEYEDFMTEAIDWGEFLMLNDAEKQLAQVRNEISRKTTIFRIGLARKRDHEYTESLHNLIAVLFSTPEDKYVVNTLAIEALTARIALTNAINRFADNTFYAMKYTF